MLMTKGERTLLLTAQDQGKTRWKEPGVQHSRDSQNEVVLDYQNAAGDRWLILKAPGGSGWSGRGMTSYYGGNYYLVRVLNVEPLGDGYWGVRPAGENPQRFEVEPLEEEQPGREWRKTLGRFKRRIGAP